MGINIYSLLDFFKTEKLKKKLKLKNKGNQKTNFIFWKFKDQKMEKQVKKKKYLRQT